MRRILLGVMALLLHQSIFAQENFLDGYIITAKQDTIEGFIDFRDWSANPEKVNFKKSLESKVVTYAPIALRGFGLKEMGEYYLSETVEIGLDSQKMNSLDDNASLEKENRTVFLRILVQGEKSLYQYKSSNDRVYYYIYQNEKVHLLEYKKYLAKEDQGNRFIKENNKYLGQLRLYLENCPEVQPQLNRTKYKSRELIKLFEHYYVCNGQKETYFMERERVKVKWGILTGMTSTSLTFKSASGNNSSLVDRDFEASYKLTAGLQMELVLPNNQEKWSVQNEIVYSSYSFFDERENYQNETGYSRTSVGLAYSYLKLNNMIRYTYPFGGMKLFGNVGISNGLVLSETNTKNTEILFNDELTIRQGKALDETRRHEQGLLIGMGAKIKGLSIELRHERGNGMSPYPTLGTSVKRNALLFSYQF